MKKNKNEILLIKIFFFLKGKENSYYLFRKIYFLYQIFFNELFIEIFKMLEKNIFSYKLKTRINYFKQYIF